MDPIYAYIVNLQKHYYNKHDGGSYHLFILWHYDPSP